MAGSSSSIVALHPFFTESLNWPGARPYRFPHVDRVPTLCDPCSHAPVSQIVLHEFGRELSPFCGSLESIVE